MSTSSTLVNTSDTAELRLVQILSKSLVVATAPATDEQQHLFIQECEACIARADASALFHRILHPPSSTATDKDHGVVMDDDKVFSWSPLRSLVDPSITSSSTEAYSAFTLLIVLLQRVSDRVEQTQFVYTMVSTLQALLKVYLNRSSSSNTNTKENDDESYHAIQSLEIKQRILHMTCILYNVRSSYKEKCWILSQLFLMMIILPTTSSSSSSHVVQKVHDDFILQLLPGRNTTLGTLLEYHNVVRLIEMEFSSYSWTDHVEEIPTTQEKRLLYSIASQVLKQVIDISSKTSSLQDGITTTTITGGKKMEDHHPTKNASSILLEKERTLAKINQQRFLLKVLETYQEEDKNTNTTTTTALDTVALNAAKEVTIGFIIDPISLFHDQRGITRLRPIQALKLQSDTKPLYELLEIFQTGKLEDFYQYLSTTTSPMTLQTWGIDEKTCIHHLRLLSLCSLAAEHEEIPYQAIASTLQVSMDQVEPWVISAVSSGLMNAKMDQLSQVVMVEQCVVRSFGMEEWKVLQTRLHGWKKNVGNIITALKQQQVSSSNSNNNTTASSNIVVSLSQGVTSI